MKRTDGGDQVPQHATTVELTTVVPPEVEVGTEIALRVRVRCAVGCDLRGSVVQIVDRDQVVATREVSMHGDMVNETDDFVLKASGEPGEHVWNMSFAGHGTSATIHQESCLPVSFRTIPHSTSIAVWDIPSPVVNSRSFELKVGVKCPLKCELMGQIVEICDSLGAVAGQTRLSDAAWHGTESLYWATVALVAPGTEGVTEWTAQFRGGGVALAHEDAAASFTFRTAARPEHRVTIAIVENSTTRPAEGVEVRLGPYEVYTDASGLALFEVPKGHYRLNIRKDGLDAQPISVDVDRDVTVHVAASTVATKAQREEAMMRFEDYPWG